MDEDFDINVEYCTECEQITAQLVHKFRRTDGNIDVLSECEACGYEQRYTIE
jgi:RNase P subunit RPR2